MGHINASLSAWLLEQNLVVKVLGRPNTILFANKKSLPEPGRFIFPGYYTPLPKDLIDRITKTAKRQGIKIGGENFFHHARTIAKASKETWARMDIFMQLYGFCRNICFALLGAAILLAKEWFLHGSKQIGILSAIALVISLVMLYRYLKFFRQYSYEMFTAYPDLASEADKK